MEIIKKTSFDRIYAFSLASLVLKEGSFASAARRIGIAPSNVTKEIQKLEEYLGIKIFKRTTRSISLTQEGRVAIERSRRIINDLGELEENLLGSLDVSKGSLRITAPTTLGQSFFADIIADYQISHPYIDIDLRFTDRILDPVEQDIDISIRTAFTLKDSSMFVRRIGHVKRVIVASTKYLESFKRPRNPDELHEHNCLLYMRGDSPFIWSFEKGNIKKNIHVTGTYRSNNLLSLIRACEKGVGILNIPEYLVKSYIDEGKLKVILKTWKLPAHNIFLLTSRKPSQSRKLLTMVNYLSEETKKREC